MTTSESQQRQIDRLKLVAAGAAIVALVACAALWVISQNKATELYQIPLGIAINIASNLLVFICAWLILAKRMSIPSTGNETPSEATIVALTENLTARIESALKTADEEHTRRLTDLRSELARISSKFAGQTTALALGNVQWQVALESAREVHFVVQGWDRWMDDNESAVRKFLLSGGLFNLYVYDPASEKNSRALHDMATRLSKTPRDVQQEIAGTVSRLLALQDALPHPLREKNPVTIHYIKTVNWYFAVRIRGRKYPGGGAARDIIIFSIYSHKRASVQRMPALVMYPDEDEEFDRWFEAELDYLRTSAIS